MAKLLPKDIQAGIMFAKCHNCGCEIHLKLVDETKQPKLEDIYCYKCWQKREHKDENSRIRD